MELKLPISYSTRFPFYCYFIWSEWKFYAIDTVGGRKGLRDLVLLDFWCGFTEIFMLSCGIEVSQNQALCGI